IAALGLEALASTRSPGLTALMEVAGVAPPLSATDIGFRLGPRLNAPGRLDAADKALQLLLSRSRTEARALAAELDRWNRDRQASEQQVVSEAREAVLQRAESQPDGEMPPILVAWSERWHRGVVGIAAGRLAREFHRPTLLLAVEEDSATGSGRSLPGIHLHGFLDAWRDDLLRFGGHAQAVGLTAPRAELDSLRDAWEAAARRWLDVVRTRHRRYELSVTVDQVTPALLDQIERLAPFGQGNARPLLRVRGPLTLLGPPRRFGNGHLSALCRPADGEAPPLRLLGWGWQARSGDLEAAPFELLGHLEHDRYRGGIVLRLVDARAHDPARDDDPLTIAPIVPIAQAASARAADAPAEPSP
ncbi:MAG: DHHA1 domain-containing protein, partial [Acidobacteriota bacterium]